MKIAIHKSSALIFFVAGIAVFTGCTTVSETGRTQFNMLSSEQESQLGLTAFEELKQETPISTDAGVNAMVKRVGERVAAVADLPGAQWEFVVFDSPEANAFCLPGGKVGIYTGILPITKDEAGMATVIGHEVAHAVARHGGERVTQAMAMEGVGQVLGAVTADSKWQAATMTAYGLGSQVGMALPHSRKQESEADYIGLLYMARAGYDPEAAIGFWQRFAAFNQEVGGATPWFLRTHPLDETRISQLQKWMPEAKAEYLQRP